MLLIQTRDVSVLNNIPINGARHIVIANIHVKPNNCRHQRFQVSKKGFRVQ
jgi:hypothetical protein